MKQFYLLLILSLSAFSWSTSAHAEICAVNTTCMYTLYNHSPRIIKFTELEKGRIYQCNFHSAASGWSHVDVRSYNTRLSPGLTVTLNSGSTVLPASVVADAINMETASGYFYATFKPNITLSSPEKITLACFVIK